MDKIYNQDPVEILYEELCRSRIKPRKKSKIQKAEKKNRPIASWVKPDRLRSGLGKELCIILKTNGCAWSRSITGGCTMCGYFNDRAEESITTEDLISQFDFALEKHTELINNSEESIAIKLFNSGSFLDDNEVPESAQTYILQKLASLETVKEIVVESLPAYITIEKLCLFKSILGEKYLEFGIGLESSNDFVRKSIINKSFNFATFQTVHERIKLHGFFTRAYILLKPPFLTEIQSILDTVQTIQKCLSIQVNTISINPVNVQENTLCRSLFQFKSFQPPNYYSLFLILRTALNKQSLENTRIVSDPSGSGTERGIHSCHRKDCNQNMQKILEEFNFTQDITIIPDKLECICWLKWKYKVFEQI